MVSRSLWYYIWSLYLLSCRLLNRIEQDVGLVHELTIFCLFEIWWSCKMRFWKALQTQWAVWIGSTLLALIFLFAKAANSNILWLRYLARMSMPARNNRCYGFLSYAICILQMHVEAQRTAFAEFPLCFLTDCLESFSWELVAKTYYICNREHFMHMHLEMSIY